MLLIAPFVIFEGRRVEVWDRSCLRDSHTSVNHMKRVLCLALGTRWTSIVDIRGHSLGKTQGQSRGQEFCQYHIILKIKIWRIITLPHPFSPLDFVLKHRVQTKYNGISRRTLLLLFIPECWVILIPVSWENIKGRLILPPRPHGTDSHMSKSVLLGLTAGPEPAHPHVQEGNQAHQRGHASHGTPRSLIQPCGMLGIPGIRGWHPPQSTAQMTVPAGLLSHRWPWSWRVPCP